MSHLSFDHDVHLHVRSLARIGDSWQTSHVDLVVSFSRQAAVDRGLDDDYVPRDGERHICTSTPAYVRI
ncbi:hypothetical protein CRI94_03370 [Longibacter salinarum]|uniref:Uncharacterized protein n=1 Tax=Longibacter salinarum TaxID=1850348 RepID=A0A2A8D375_9BACT|nr:hypothetical protein CRI94_03370 [Longibacter salinarum]